MLRASLGAALGSAPALVAATAYGAPPDTGEHPSSRDAAPAGHSHLLPAELFYVAHLNSWASLQPDVQCFSPGSDSARHAWAIGLGWSIHAR